MELSIQVQSLAFCFLYAFFFCFLYAFFNRFFYKIRKSFVRYLLEIVFCGLAAIIFFFILLEINNGSINLYMIVCFIIGLFVYEIIYARYVLVYYEKVIKFFRYIFSPLRFIFKQISAILKHSKKVMKKWLSRRRKKEEDLNEVQEN